MLLVVTILVHIGIQVAINIIMSLMVVVIALTRVTSGISRVSLVARAAIFRQARCREGAMALLLRNSVVTVIIVIKAARVVNGLAVRWDSTASKFLSSFARSSVAQSLGRKLFFLSRVNSARVLVGRRLANAFVLSVVSRLLHSELVVIVGKVSKK